MGSFTDLNVWSKDLTEDEMREFTKCGSMMRGDLIPWNIDDWMFTPDIDPSEYKVESVDFDSMCLPLVSYTTGISDKTEFQSQILFRKK